MVSGLIRRAIPLQTALLVTHGILLALPFALLLGTDAWARDLAAQRELELAREAVLARTIVEAVLGDVHADPQSWSSMEPLLAQVYAETGLGFRLVDSAGIVRASNGPRRGESLADRPEVISALAGTAVTVSRKEVPPSIAGPAPGPEGARAWSFAAVPLSGGALLVIHASREPMEALQAISADFGWGAATVTAAALSLAVYAGWRLSRSLRALAGIAEGIAEGAELRSPLLAEVGATRVAEVRQLAHAFATMTARLDEKLKYNHEFASNVSHEFKTPLATLRGTVDLLMEDTAMPPEQRTRFLENARTDLDRLDRMVGGLLDLARAEAPSQREPVDLDDVVAAVVRRFPGIRVRGRTCVVNADRSQLEVAVGQLVENALQHGGTSVGVEVGDQVIVVTDDGPGISPAVLPRIFDRFFTTSADRSGTGLGLAIVRAIARAHGGEVTVESGASGTTFRFSLGT